MDTIFMKSENSKTSHHGLLYNTAGYIALKGKS